MLKKAAALFRDNKKRNFFIYGIGQAFNLLSPLVVAPYIISVCSEEGFGKVGLGFAVALFLILIVDYAFEIKGIKQVAENRNDKGALNKILSTVITTKVFLFAGTLIIALLLINLIPFFKAEKPLLMLSLFIVLAQVFNPIWFLQGIEEFAIGSAVNIGSKITYVLLVYGLISYEGDYIWVNFYLGISALIFNLAGLLYIFVRYQMVYIKPTLKQVQTILREDFSFCVSQLFLSVRQLSPLVLTSYFLGYHVAGLYKVIEQIFALFRTFTQVFLKYFYPSACHRIMGDEAAGLRYWRKYSSMVLGVVALSSTIIFLLSEPILRYFNVSEISIIEILQIFRLSLLLPILLAVTLPLEQLMFLLNKSRIYVPITIIVTSVNVILIILTHWLQLAGVVGSLIVAEFLFILIYYRYALYRTAIK